MSQKIILSVAVVAFVLVSFFLIFNKEETLPPDSSFLLGGWVKIISGTAEVTRDGSVKALSSGEMVYPGDLVQLSKDGKMTIQLQDGSVLRASEGAEFYINRADFSGVSGSLVIDVSLKNGRIWSKIIELATPDSLWSVKTSNTVATVRGSAFGISTDGNVSKIIGSQHKVYLGFLDKETGIRISEREVVVEEGFSLDISDEVVAKIKTTEEILATNPSPEESKILISEIEGVLRPIRAVTLLGTEKEWVLENESSDKTIEEKIDSIKKDFGQDKKYLREKLIEEALNSSIEVKRVIPVLNTKTESKEPVSTERISVPAPVGKLPIVRETSEQNNEPVARTKWDELVIKNSGILAGVLEGSPISFSATLRNSSGEEKDVTNEVSWEVLGPVGKMEKPGFFVPQLELSVSDLGEGFGYVVATWKGPGGEILLGKSGQIQVLLTGEITPIDTRGQ
jgi:hypothetical protein